MIIENSMNALLADGFTRRMASEYLGTIAKECASPLFDNELRTWAHSRGFFAETVACLGITDANAGEYLSDYDYYRVWPLNSWQRVWINDKLTLKYMLSGTTHDRYLPKYFFYQAKSGLVPLLDSGLLGKNAPCGQSDFREEFLGLLRAEGEYACKPANAELAMGFHKLSFDGESYRLDNNAVGEDEVLEYARTHSNDLFTEFLHPGGILAQISPVIHTLRVLTVNEGGVNPRIAAAYLRLATDVGGDDSKANYRPPDEAGVRSYNLSFDIETGEFANGCLVYGDKTVATTCHPDTGVAGEGTMECWPELKEEIIDLSYRLGPVEYMGFDVCATTRGPKIMEINSHSGSKYLQLYKPFMSDPFLADYFTRKLDAIDSLSESERLARNDIMR